MSRIRLSQLARVAGLLLVSAVHAWADLLYDNGSPNLVNGFEMTHWKEANPFTLTSGVAVTGITFWDVEASPVFQTQIYWEIRSANGGAAPGSILFSGMSVNLTHVATGRSAFTVYPEFINNFGVPGISLPAGSYWLVLHNGPYSNNAGQDIFWETTTSLSLAPSYLDAAPFGNNWNSNGAASQLAFQLSGILESARPRITAISVSGGIARITFTTVSGQHYRVEYSNSLLQPQWTPVAGSENVSGTGAPVQVSDLGVGVIKQRFYRVVLL